MLQKLRLSPHVSNMLKRPIWKGFAEEKAQLTIARENRWTQVVRGGANQV
jgi:hypothetical protein